MGIGERLGSTVEYDMAVSKVLSDNTGLSQRLGRAPRFYIETLGCQQNEADSEKLSGMAVAMGYEKCESPDKSELIIVNTCAIREHAEQRALSIIGRYKHLKSGNPELILAVCGCMPSQEHRMNELKMSYPYVDIVFGTAYLSDFPQLLSEYRTRRKRIFLTGESTAVPGEMPSLRSSSFKAWISIMYGCNNFCSYCIVPYVRGRERSRNPEHIIAEVKNAVDGGYRDITLLGQNVNSYGTGSDFGVTFPKLLRRLSDIDGDYLLRFMTSHPKDVSDSLISVMAESEHIAKHFHLPLQSGSDEILRRMNRRYTSKKYLETAAKLRSAMPGIAITSDIIVGFPGETEDDFSATLDVVRESEFDMIYPFMYSPRKGTPASEMENQIPDEVKSERFDRLLELQNSLSRKKNEAEVGNTVRVLVEGEDKKRPGEMIGRTGGSKLVHAAGKYKIGEFADVEITSADTFALFGTIKK